MNPQKVIVVTHVIISHSCEIYGPGHAVADFLKSRVHKLIFVRYPLKGFYRPRLTLFIEGETKEERRGLKIKSENLVSYLRDFFATIFLVLKVKERFDLYIGVNNLNTLAGILLRTLRLVKQVIFYTADYAPIRFRNPILNHVYHWVDRKCIHSADFVWSNSRAMVGIRRRQGVPEERNIYVPHGADLSKIKHYPASQVIRKSLVIVANLTRAFDFKMILDAVQEITEKIQDAKLIIIGIGPEEKNIKKYSKERNLEKNVQFKGWMAHDELLTFLPRYGVGLAIYTTECSWTPYSDSLKVKEYLACGLPVIMAGAQAAIEEVRESRAVILIDLNKDELTNTALNLFSDDAFYKKCKENAIAFAEKLDWTKRYSKKLSFLFK